MKRPQIRSRAVLTASILSLLGLLLVAALWVFPTPTAGPLSQTSARLGELAAAPAAQREVSQAWQRAVELGSYRYTTDVIQTTIPLATVQNMGRSSKQQAIHLEGESNLRDQSMHLTLWMDGGSVLNPASGIEMKVEDGRTFGRRGYDEWQETGSVTDWVAPEGDFLAFLTAATNVRNEGADLRGNGDVTRFTFEVDGPRFGAYVRDQMTARMTADGELPPGVQLGLPETYAEMTGTGELWVDGDGLPLRQVLRLNLPGENDYRVEAEVITDFSGYDRQQLASAPAPLSFSALISFGQDLGRAAGRQASTTAAMLVVLAFCFVLIRHTGSKPLQKSLSGLVIFSMVALPALQSTQTAAFYDKQRTIQTTKQDQQAAAVQQQEFAESVATNPFGTPLTDTNPLQAIRNDTGTDTDGDGLHGCPGKVPGATIRSSSPQGMRPWWTMARTRTPTASPTPKRLSWARTPRTRTRTAISSPTMWRLWALTTSMASIATQIPSRSAPWTMGSLTA